LKLKELLERFLVIDLGFFSEAEVKLKFFISPSILLFVLTWFDANVLWLCR